METRFPTFRSVQADCPTCGRSIIIEAGRFTRHSDKRYWSGRPIPSCPMSEMLLGHPNPVTWE